MGESRMADEATRRVRLSWLAGPLVVGVLAGLGAFALTAQHQQYVYLGPLCRSNEVRAAGFDPWTGQPIGSIYVCEQTHPDDPPTHLVTGPIPDDLLGRRAIPVQAGFAFGFVATALLLWLRRRRVTFTDAD